MATFGNTSIGSTPVSIHSSTNNKTVSKFTLSEAGTVTKLSIYLDGNGTGSGPQVIKGVIYDDDGASAVPGTLMGTSEEVSIADAAAAAWVDFTFASPVALTSGNWYLGLIAGSNIRGAQMYQESTSPTDNIWKVSDTYTDGASDPFGAATTQTDKLSVYATYTVPVSGSGAITILS